MQHRITAAGLLAALATLPAYAEVKINEYLSVSGYAAVAAANTDFEDADDQDSFFDSGANNLDSVKGSLIGKYGDFGGVVSLLYLPGASDEAGLIEYYGTYTVDAFTITAGKFLSYLGYEAFNAPDMTQLTYGSTIGAIPAYHAGAKVDYSADTWGAGVAVVDSIYPERGLMYGGDRDFEDELGFEAFFVYKGIEKLTLWQGVAYEDTDGGSEVLVYNVWASYDVTDKLNVAAEYVYSDDVSQALLGFVKYTWTDKIYTVGRISGADFDSGYEEIKYTFSPTYLFTDYLLGRAEISYTDTDGGEDSLFYGAQAVLKF